MTEILTFENNNKMNHLIEKDPNSKSTDLYWIDTIKEPHLYFPQSSNDNKPQEKQNIKLTENDLQNFKKESKMTVFLDCEKIVKNNECELIIDLQSMYLRDKYINSIKCKFNYENQDGHNILNNILDSKYEIIVGGAPIYSEIFYEDKELLLNTTTSTPMLLPIKVFTMHQVKLKIRLSFDSYVSNDILKFLKVEMCVNTVDFYDDVDEKILPIAYINSQFDKYFSKIEQIIINKNNKYNIFVVGSGMGGTAIDDFIEEERFLKYRSGKPWKKPKQHEENNIIPYEIGKYKGYKSKNLHFPKYNYDFCSRSIDNDYKLNSSKLQYSLIANNEGKYVHSHEIMTDYQINLGYGNTPHAIGNLCITYPQKLTINKDDIKLYFLVLDCLKNITLKKINVNIEIDETENDFQIKTNQYLSIFENMQCTGFLLEHTSDTKENQLSSDVNVHHDTYFFSGGNVMKIYDSADKDCLFTL